MLDLDDLSLEQVSGGLGGKAKAKPASATTSSVKKTTQTKTVRVPFAVPVAVPTPMASIAPQTAQAPMGGMQAGAMPRQSPCGPGGCG